MTGTAQPEYEDITFTGRDGLRLYGRRYPAAGQGASAARSCRPVLCLAGLTRNGRDFHELALALSRHPAAPRTVFTFDYRGRGHSQSDPDWRNYAVPIELLDVQDFLTVCGLHGVAVIGTSRGGLIAMLLAAAQPTSLGAIVLNDIGPVIEPAGLARISAYVGRTPLPRTWPDAARIARDMNSRHFPNITEAEWEAVARQWFNEDSGRPSPGYDGQLARAMSVLDGPTPALWPQFEGFKRMPVLVVRGANSDILSAETVEEMRRRHPMFSSITVPDQGHAPLLRDAPTIAAIQNFFEAVDAGRPGALARAG